MGKREDLRKLHHDVVFKKAGGKIIWQPRIGCWYDDRIVQSIPFPERYRNKNLLEIYEDLGCSARPYLEYNQAFIRVEPETVHRYINKLNDLETEYVVETPVGKLTEIGKKVEGVSREQRMKWRICDEKDLRTAIWLEENTEWRFDENIFGKMDDAWGKICSPTIYMPRINIQSLFINDMGVANGVYALYDYEDLIEEYFDAMNRNHMRMIEVINKSPVDIINFGDNLHCSTLSPELFERFVLPAYIERTAKLHEAGKFVSAHWDGDTKSLLKYARQTGLDGIEAITPKPQGDVELEFVKENLGDMFLLDGVAAILFDPAYTEEDLIEQTEKVISLFAPNLVLGISDEISYTGDIERVRLIGNLVDQYNERMKN